MNITFPPLSLKTIEFPPNGGAIIFPPISIATLTIPLLIPIVEAEPGGYVISSDGDFITDSEGNRLVWRQ